MFHHLIPVGLSTSLSCLNEHSILEQNIIVAVKNICESSTLLNISFNQSHPDTKALLKSLDAFFSHGYLFFVFY